MLAALYPTLIFYTELLYSELLFMALLLAGIDLLLGAGEHRRRWIAIAAAGVCFGLASLVKTQGLLLPGVLTGGALVLRRIGFRQAVLTGLVAHAHASR